MTDCRYPQCSCERDCDDSPALAALAAAGRAQLARDVAELREKATAVLEKRGREPYHVLVNALRWCCTPERILRLCDEIERGR